MWIIQSFICQLELLVILSGVIACPYKWLFRMFWNYETSEKINPLYICISNPIT